MVTPLRTWAVRGRRNVKRNPAIWLGPRSKGVPSALTPVQDTVVVGGPQSQTLPGPGASTSSSVAPAGKPETVSVTGPRASAAPWLVTKPPNTMRAPPATGLLGPARVTIVGAAGVSWAADGSCAAAAARAAAALADAGKAPTGTATSRVARTVTTVTTLKPATPPVPLPENAFAALRTRDFPSPVRSILVPSTGEATEAQAAASPLIAPSGKPGHFDPGISRRNVLHPWDDSDGRHLFDRDATHRAWFS